MTVFLNNISKSVFVTKSDCSLGGSKYIIVYYSKPSLIPGVTLSKNPAKCENVNLKLCWKNGVRGAKDKGSMVI